jgi:protein-export membrane protein SecD/preprotein translocase SecF subunit
MTLWAIYTIAPTMIYFSMAKEVRNDSETFDKAVPDWLPKKHSKLGLDLQGGVQLVLGVETSGAVENRLQRTGVEAAGWAQEDGKVKIESAFVTKGSQVLTIKLGEGQDPGEFTEKFKKEYVGLEKTGGDGKSRIDFGYSPDHIKKIKVSALEQAERVIRSRVDKWGVAEPMISRRADGSILVQLPGFKDPDKAKELLGRTAQLKFKIVDDAFSGFADLKAQLPEGITLSNNGGQAALVGEDRQAIVNFIKEKSKLTEDHELLFGREELAGGAKNRWTSYVVHAATELTGEDVFDANVTAAGGMDPMPQVSLQLTGSGGKRFSDVTGKNVKKRMAIVLDDVVESAPMIQTKISDGSASITLGGSRGYDKVLEEANQLVLILKSGAIPADIRVLEERQVGASLGPELANQGIKGILLGLACVLIFMLAYYRRPGIVACMALVLNGVFLLALMSGFGFSLSLPGIAGFILTLGMAVDSNVLINERIREELRDGKSAKRALELGFQKVFWTIVDANATTLIAALVLLETNSSGPVRGFAVTLIIGLIVSLFTALYCSRLFFDVAMLGKTDVQMRNWLGKDPEENKKVLSFNFIRLGVPATIGATLLVFLVFGTSLVRGVNWGVDFAGGTEATLSFSSDVEGEVLRGLAAKSGIDSMTVQALGGGKQQYLLHFDKGAMEGEAGSAGSITTFAKFKDKLMSELSAQKPEVLQVDFVGPQVGKELRIQGVQSIFWAILGIFIYVLMRFDLRFGPGAVVKMILDVSVMLGFYVFFYRTFDLTSVAALLTVIGYSVNDTVVIYDRIRENIVSHGRRGIGENVNISLNETLSRSINTSLVTIVSLIGILVFGTGQIWDFAMAMTIGVVIVTFTSTFVASSFVIWSEIFWKKRATARGIKGSGGAKPAHAR